MKSLISICFILLLSTATSIFAAQVNINTADADTIATEISGIGENRARAIVEYRKVNGKFMTVDDLTKVKGIGEKTVEKNRKNISL